MRYRVSGLRVSPSIQDGERLLQALARSIEVPIDHISDLVVLRRATDARSRVRRICTVVTLEADISGLPRRIPPGLQVREIGARAPIRRHESSARGLRAVVVGSGPAGLFAALALARDGARVTLLEQGPPMRERVAAVAGFWSRGVLDPAANVQFGAGGAGTFSDGKLTHRTRDPMALKVLETFVALGAPERILSEAHPHLGTDGARVLIASMIDLLRETGVQVAFRTAATAPRRTGDAWEIECAGETLAADAVFLAPGHSARPLLRSLAASGVPFRGKGFAVGVRAEHPQEWLDARQYRRRPGTAGLPPAGYRLTSRDPETGRAVYSFCMCPGGIVVNASSEEGGVVTNGMGISVKASGLANAGIVVAVSASDFGPDPMAGMAFQERVEREAFRMGGSSYAAPAQTAAAFKEDRAEGALPRSSYRPALRPARLAALFPDFVSGPLARSLEQFDRLLPGFVEKGLLVAPETRTSCPVQVVRGPDGAAVGFPGLYLIGEGSGWAGGIVSSAVDALRICELALGRVPFGGGGSA